MVSDALVRIQYQEAAVTTAEGHSTLGKSSQALQYQKFNLISLITSSQFLLSIVSHYIFPVQTRNLKLCLKSGLGHMKYSI